MGQTLTGKALLHALEHNPKVHNPQALEAWIGRMKKLRHAGKSGTGNGGMGTLLPHKGTAIYNEKTHTITTTKGAFKGLSAVQTQEQLKHLEKTYPEASHIKYSDDAKPQPLHHAHTLVANKFIAEHAAAKKKADAEAAKKAMEPKTISLPFNGHKATYDPKTHTVTTTEAPFKGINADKTDKQLKAIKDSFPEATKIKYNPTAKPQPIHHAHTLAATKHAMEAKKAAKSESPDWVVKHEPLTLPSGKVATYNPKTKHINMPSTVGMSDAKMADDYDAALKEWPDAKTIAETGQAKDPVSDIKHEVADYYANHPKTSVKKSSTPNTDTLLKASAAKKAAQDKPNKTTGYLGKTSTGTVWTKPPKEKTGNQPVHFRMDADGGHPFYYTGSPADAEALAVKHKYTPGATIKGTYNPDTKRITLDVKNGPLSEGQVKELRKAFPDKATHIMTPSGKHVTLHNKNHTYSAGHQTKYGLKTLMGGNTSSGGYSSPSTPYVPPPPKDNQVDPPALPKGVKPSAHLAGTIPGPYDGDKAGGHWDTPGQANSWAKKAYTPWAKSLTPEERSALHDYKGNDYIPINSQLRNGGLKASKAAKIKKIDNAIAKAPPLTEDITVYRGRLPNPILQAFQAGTEDGLVGKTFGDPSYTSTSIDRGTAKGFSHSSKFPFRSMGKIRLPKGTRTAYLEAIWDRGEHEPLLPRDAQIRVDKVYTDPQGIKWIEGEYILPEEDKAAAAKMPQAPMSKAGKAAATQKTAMQSGVKPQPAPKGTAADLVNAKAPTLKSIYSLPITELRKLAKAKGIDPTKFTGKDAKHALAAAVKAAW